MYTILNKKNCCALKYIIFKYRKYWLFNPDIPVDENFISKFKGHLI